MPAGSTPAILIAPYDPAWPAMFEAERARLKEAIGQWAITIEHVGSTTVPGLAAKPIIDIGVSLRELKDALSCITPLIELGYECLGEYGIPGRIYFRKRTGAPLSCQAHNNRIGRTHQIHMYKETHEQHRWHIAFRDYLRTHPAAAREYEARKRHLASEHDDVEIYAEAKTDFVMGILERAGERGAAS